MADFRRFRHLAKTFPFGVHLKPIFMESRDRNEANDIIFNRKKWISRGVIPIRRPRNRPKRPIFADFGLQQKRFYLVCV